jgi:hypothetical protein
MKQKMCFLILTFALIFPALSQTLWAEEKSLEARLEKADAMQAMAIANDWKWSQPNIRSFVTPQEVVFKFPDGKEKKIALPKDKMIVAVAPYIQQTHT